MDVREPVIFQKHYKASVDFTDELRTFKDKASNELDEACAATDFFIRICSREDAPNPNNRESISGGLEDVCNERV